jgi:hypothetical protein
VLAVAGVGAYALRGGGSELEANSAQVGLQTNTESAATVAALGPQDGMVDASAVNATANATEPQAAQPTEQQNAAEALRSEKAKTAAAEAKLAALKKAAARTAAAQAVPGAPPLPASKAEQKAAAAQTASSRGGISPAKLGQFNGIVDEGRSMAKQAMRSNNKQNAQMAKNYDQYLKTLKDSMRGIQSDKEADKLIKQASQTRAYIQYLLRQP